MSDNLKLCKLTYSMGVASKRCKENTFSESTIRKGEINMGNWYEDMYGKEAFQAMLEEFTVKEMWNVDRTGKKYRVRVIQQEHYINIELSYRHTGIGADRRIPMGGFTLKQREEIADKALAAAEAGLPIMLKEIMAPMLKGYWEDEEWDIINVHRIDRSKINPNYHTYLE